eukprot:gene2368-2728_t
MFYHLATSLSIAFNGLFRIHREGEQGRDINYDPFVMASNRNDRRTATRQKSEIIFEEGKNRYEILKSLQTCHSDDIEKLLEKNIANTQGNIEQCSHLKGLKAVWQELITRTTSDDGQPIRKGFMTLDEGFALYLGYTAHSVKTDLLDRDKKKRFKELLCHEKYGLGIYIINGFIVIRPNNFDLHFFACAMMSKMQSDQIANKENERLILDKSLVQKLINSMDTEWDKKIARVTFGACRSRSEIDKLGIRSHDIKKLTDHVMDVIQAKDDTKMAATNKVKANVDTKIETLDRTIRHKEAFFRSKTFDFNDLQQDELSEEIECLRERRNALEKLNNPSTKYDIKRFNEMVNRASIKLVREKRLGLRKKSVGRPRGIDEEDEKFLLRCIESKTTAHGRRSDQVMYTNHRVKKRDFIKLVNYHRHQRNLKPIRSSTTVYNRSRPRNKVSKQAKLHLGLGLFCAKKPPKTEKNENELTHHQRAHKKNIINFLCDAEREEDAKYVVEISMDDKAYLCPGTSTGMSGARSLKIYQPSNDEEARKLPKYDFPVAMVNVTPSGYRIMEKRVKKINNKSETEIIADSCYVFVRPKYFLGSSGTVWASEIMQLRQEAPHKFEIVSNVEGASQQSMAFKSICITLLDAMTYYIDSAEKDDVMKLLTKNNDKHKEYESCRANVLQESIWKVFATASADKETMSKEDKANFDTIREIITNTSNAIVMLKNQLSEKTHPSVWGVVCSIVENCISSVQKIKGFGAQYRSRFLEWTDAGPGVGISNHDVVFRIGQRVRITDADYLIRLHLSNGDSSQNEIERCHAYIGDAICDGAGLDWEYKKLYNEKTIKVVKKMSIDELREYELKRMEYNAYHVCDEVTSRIDGAPGPGGFLKSYRAVKKKDLFFKDKEFLDSFLSKSGKEQAGLPGGKYYSKISKFITDHCEIGEKHLEFLKFECRNRKDGVCDYCKCHDWVGPPCTKVPRPYPDYSQLPEYHYQHVSVTPKVLNGVEREVDDFQPRKKIKEFFESEGVTAFEENKLQEFCNKYIIEMSVVRQYLEHLQTLELNKEKRKLERKRNISEENLQNYEDIDWVSHYKNSSLKQLKVKTLDKYLEKHEMTAYLSVKKKDKVVAITYHIAFQQLQRSLAEKNKAKKRVMPELQSESDDDEEEDVIIDIAGKEDSSNTSSEGEESQDETPEISNNDEFEEDLSHLFCVTRSGRLTQTWACSRYR